MRVPPDQSGTASRHRRQRGVGAGARSSLVIAGQPRREQERLDPLVPPRQGVREMQQHARVALHRSADVAQQHEGPRPHASRPPRQLDDVAAGAQAVARWRAADRCASRARDPSARPPLAGFQTSRAAPRAPSASSSAVNAAKSLPARPLEVAPGFRPARRLPRRCLSSSSVVASRSGASRFSIGTIVPARFALDRRSRGGGSVECSRQNTSNTRSKIASVPGGERAARGRRDTPRRGRRGRRAQRLDEVEQPAGMHLDASAPQHPAEDQQVVEEARTQARCPVHAGIEAPRARRDRHLRRSAPRRASRSSLAFSTTPSVSSTASASSACGRARRAPLTQSMRLRHAWHLVELARAQLLHDRGDLLGQLAPTPRARASRTMASSFSNDG